MKPLATDERTVQVWLRHFWIGIGSTTVTAIAGAAYAALTWSGPDRQLLLALSVGAILSAGLVGLLPHRRILASRWATVFFYAWSAVLCAFISVAVVVDGGAASPMVAMYFLVLAFIATAYPPSGVVAVGALTVGAYLGVALVQGGVADGDLVFVGAALAVAGTMAALLADTHWGHTRAREELTRRLALQAQHDGLTGCLNHRAFHERLRAELAAARAGRRPLALLMADLDLFKGVNDGSGHPAGDELLVSAGRALGETGNEQAIIARTGGDEFSLLLPGTELADAEAIAERIRVAVGRIEDPAHTTVSLGVSSFPECAQTARELIERADLALYAAKHAGRDCVRVFGPRLEAEQAEVLDAPDLSLRRRLAQVIEEGAVSAVFQPVVALEGGEVLGYESLGRVADSGMAPDRWLALAGQVGMREAFEVEMWEAALRAGPPPDGAILFLNAGPEALLSGALEPYRSRFGSEVVIELSEEQAVADYDALSEVLAAWVATGVRIAVDDVGSGHANLEHTLQIAPSFLKLDRGLVANVHADPARLALVEAIASFAGRTGSVVIAEGVEAHEDAEALAGVGIRYGQGWLFAKADPHWAPSGGRVPVQARAAD